MCINLHGILQTILCTEGNIKPDKYIVAEEATLGHKLLGKIHTGLVSTLPNDIEKLSKPYEDYIKEVESSLKKTVKFHFGELQKMMTCMRSDLSQKVKATSSQIVADTGGDLVKGNIILTLSLEHTYSISY